MSLDSSFARSGALRLPGRAARAVFGSAALAALTAGLSEGALAAQAATQRPARAQSVASTVVLVLRHAERAAEPGADPALSEAGVARARQLADAARAARVEAVFATQFRRTLETATPLAEAAGVSVTERPVTATNATRYVEDLAREIRERHAGRTVAVVGHANTVPALVGALTGRPAPALGESDYGDVFVVVLPPAGGDVRLLHLRVGR